MQNQQIFLLYMMQNNHSDMPLLKFLKSVNQIKSYVEKSELVQFFEIANFSNDSFLKTHDQHSFKLHFACLFIFPKKPCLCRFHNRFCFFGSRYHFSKIFGYNAPHNTLVSAWHVMTDTRKPKRKGIYICFLSFLDTLYIVNTK